jgi:septum formation protein
MTALPAPRLILASASPYRAALLANAGIVVEKISAEIDERAVEDTLEKSELTPADIAQVLAQAKADEVSSRLPDAFVIGSDQTLSLDGVILHKPADMDAAIDRLMALSGKTHSLNSAVCIVRNAEVLWTHVEIAHITFRKLDPAFVGRHLGRVGKKALTSVGGYQVEGEGAQLIDYIDGDFFSIIGLPLLPLLAQLRKQGIIDG